MSKIVVAHDVPQRMHPALQATVHQITHVRNRIGSDLTAGCIPLLAFSSVEDDVELDKAEVAERLLDTL